MLIELLITNQADQERVRHLVICPEHRRELIARLRELLDRAAAIDAPATVSMWVGETGPDHSEQGDRDA